MELFQTDHMGKHMVIGMDDPLTNEEGSTKLFDLRFGEMGHGRWLSCYPLVSQQQVILDSVAALHVA